MLIQKLKCWFPITRSSTELPENSRTRLELATTFFANYYYLLFETKNRTLPQHNVLNTTFSTSHSLHRTLHNVLT